MPRPNIDASPRAPLQLRALTLRGIGSYVRGARLDLRPLTILCGTNGSGKSTWFRALGLLRASVSRDYFPFYLCEPLAEGRVHTFGFTNALLATSENWDFDDLADADEDAHYGPHGTLGVELVANQEVRLGSAMPSSDTSDATRFLLDGVIAAGASVRLMLTTPELVELLAGGPSATYRPQHIVDLTIAKRYHVRFELDPEGNTSFQCSKGLLTPGAGARLVPVGSFAERDLRESVDDSAADISQSPINLARLARHRIRQAVRAALDSCFHIGAVRTPDFADFAEEEPRERRVGERGELTHSLERSFTDNAMRHAREPRAGHTDQTFHPGQIYGAWYVLGQLARGRKLPKSSPVRRIWERCGKASVRTYERLCRKRNREPLDPSLDMEAESRRLAAAALNETLESESLFHPTAWPELGVEGRELATRAGAGLDVSERRRLNRLLIEQTFSGHDGVASAHSYTFGLWYAHWMRHLVDASPFDRDRSRAALADAWRSDRDRPSGFLRSLEPRRDVDDSDDDFGSRALGRYAHPCFGRDGYPAAPANMSSGFHQVAPIVVQAGLLARGETLTIENPEVHLHPGLQLRLTEFLIDQARTGRLVVIETHSDILIRRTLRAILEEELPQAAVAIYFASLGDEILGYRSSKLERMSINAQGQIENWPRGFLTDDVEESERLINAMYGSAKLRRRTER
ncbi:MAG: AAA family ATPase [Planctomycetes bacterium]|nr:AAA family ATPase [Planctomycetota bacterium]